MADTAPKPFVFVLMPFEKAFDDVYKLGIKPACEEAGAYCERVDEQVFEGSILARVYNQISKADLIVADMSGQNPNVFYEVGYAHALGKQVILATHKAEDIPFDLKHHSHIVYSDSISDLKAEVLKRVSWIINNVPRRLESIDKSVRLYIDRKPLTDAFSINYPQPLKPMSLEIHNPTSKAFPSQSIRIGIITRTCFDGDTECFVKAVPLPDDRVMFLLPTLGTLFPSAWESLGFNILPTDLQNPFTSEKEVWVIRVFSELGSTDYPITVLTGYNSHMKRAFALGPRPFPITFRHSPTGGIVELDG